MEWIAMSSADRPSDGEWVLVTGEYFLSNGKKRVFYARYKRFRDEFFTGTELEESECVYTTQLFNVTHWMPLPEAAEDKSDIPHDKKVRILREKLESMKGTVSEQWYEDTESAINALEEGDVWSAMRVMIFCLMGIPKENRPG